MHDPKNHELWKDFEAFCIEQGISLADEADWKDWWLAFIAGSDAQFRLNAVGE